MKTKIATFLTLASLSGFSAELPSDPKDISTAATALSVSSQFKTPKEEAIQKEGYLYVRFLTSDTDITHTNVVTPGLGVGYRYMLGNGAMDISISANGMHSFTKTFWTLPKASYLYYLTPDKKESFYAGGGIAWGGVHNRNDKAFIGLIPSATVGYEFILNAASLGFTELTVSQPAVPVYISGKSMGPIAEISVGAGF